MPGELKLNKGQQVVLDHKSGPLLVVAGAGTGKTRVIVEKIGKLLDEGVAPESILAVTFTEKSAAEMLDRLLLSRSGFQTDLPITTFNGLGDSILREFGSHIGIGRDFKLLNEQARVVFVRERIEQLELDYFLPMSKLPDQIIKDILDVFSRLKQNVVSPDEYVEFSSKMPSQDEAEQLDKKQHQELAGAYKRYIELCRNANVIDYDDQIYLVLELLKTRPNIRKVLNGRFHSIFVDEFQDTNPMQSRLIDALVNENENIVVVGDDDQSIYGFRGATLANILDFKNRYPKAKSAALTENYRSGQNILDLSYKLITNNNPYRLEASLGISKRLTSKKATGPIQLNKSANIDDEIYLLAESIKSRIDSGDEPGSIAVLVRSHRIGAKVQQNLDLLDVPCKVIGSGYNLYAQPIVRICIELLKTLAEPDNAAALHHSLTSKIFNIDNSLISAAASTAKRDHDGIEDILLNSEDEDVLRSVETIQDLRKNAGTKTVGQLLYDALSSTDFIKKLEQQAATDAASAVELQNLGQYFNSLKDFESIANQPTVFEYLVSLPALQSAGESIEDATLEISSDEVNVLTVHKAKGLEWETVYIPGLTDRAFPLQKRSYGIKIPESLTSDNLSEADEHYAEERRLMYVAVTRARKSLMLSYSDKSKSGAVSKPSRFLVEMFGEEYISSLQSNQSSKAYENSLKVAPANLPEKAAMPSKLYDGKYFYLTASDAAMIVECPLNFYYKKVLYTPELPSADSIYGSAMHAAFESINKALIGKNLKPYEEYLAELQATWSKSYYETKLQRDKSFERAANTLEAFYKRVSSGYKPLYSEKDFKVVIEDLGVVLRGRYDAIIDAGDNRVEIVDYKTSKTVDTEKKAKSRVSSSSQLTLYALAWQIEHGELPERLTLDFVDTGISASVKKTSRGIDGFLSKLGSALELAKNNEFPAGNSEHKFCMHPDIN